jgi:hypothetical protein
MLWKYRSNDFANISSTLKSHEVWLLTHIVHMNRILQNFSSKFRCTRNFRSFNFLTSTQKYKKSKVKQSCYTPWKRLAGEKVYLLLILDLALDGVSGQRHARPRFTLGKGPPVPIVQEAGWAPEPVWTKRLEEKSFAPAGDRTPIGRLFSP